MSRRYVFVLDKSLIDENGSSFIDLFSDFHRYFAEKANHRKKNGVRIVTG